MTTPIEETPQATAPVTVLGQAFTTMPQDLYIPPDAFEIILEAFQGPLDLLLYLIKKQNLDILDIPIALVTDQYMEYIALLEEYRFELAAEYLVMAAMLAEIKSRMLLPSVINEEGEEEDPRAELVSRLQAYEQIKQAAENLDKLPRDERDTMAAQVTLPPLSIDRPLPEVTIKALVEAVQSALQRASMSVSHQVHREPLSVRARMSQILQALTESKSLAFHQLFLVTEGRMGVVVSFIAILELLKEGAVHVHQESAFSHIHLAAHSAY